MGSGNEFLVLFYLCPQLLLYFLNCLSQHRRGFCTFTALIPFCILLGGVSKQLCGFKLSASYAFKDSRFSKEMAVQLFKTH